MTRRIGTAGVTCVRAGSGGRAVLVGRGGSERASDSKTRAVGVRDGWMAGAVKVGVGGTGATVFVFTGVGSDSESNSVSSSDIMIPGGINPKITSIIPATSNALANNFIKIMLSRPVRLVFCLQLVAQPVDIQDQVNF